MNIAIVEKIITNYNYSELLQLQDLDINITRFGLVDKPIQKIKKADISLNIDQLLSEDYKYIILVGADACKHVGNISSVTSHQGYLVENKFIPLTNPAMLSIRPSSAPAFNKAVDSIRKYIAEDKTVETVKTFTIQDTDLAKNLLVWLLDDKHNIVGLDTEGTALYPRDGYLLGICLGFKEKGYYIDANCIDEDFIELFQKLIETKTLILHNSKYDISVLEYHLGVSFANSNIHDTMLMHYTLDESRGTHGLKDLCIKYTPYGDYDSALEEFKRSYCRSHRIKLEDFTYDLIPIEILGVYGATDPVVTVALSTKFLPLISKNPNLAKLYNNLLLPAAEFLRWMENNGVPFSEERLNQTLKELEESIRTLQSELYNYDSVISFEKDTSTEFNPNSVFHLRNVLFVREKLQPTGILTGKGLPSTNEESLTILAKKSKLAKLLLNIRKEKKILNTYIVKVLKSLDMDGRLRTNFNLHTTTSGRLSSSGKLNMQQLPRKDKRVKKCIKAPKGYKIVSQDLGTAEMYVVAVLSKDKKLQSIFATGQDFHSTIGKMAFNLECEISEVKTLYPEARQASKAISFGILYGAGPDKVAEQCGLTVEEAKDLIKWYFSTFSTLNSWLKSQKELIKRDKFIYSVFGRKRRLPDVASENKVIAGHEIRSGINFLVQSVASDINLFAGIDMYKYITSRGMKSQIFGLVHDSILGLVPEGELTEYCAKLAEFTQMDRGVSIPGCPISLDLEIGDDYAF